MRIPVLSPQIAPAHHAAYRLAVECEDTPARLDGFSHDDAGHAELRRRVTDALITFLRPA